MIKYAFFMNMPGVKEDDYKAVYENGESYSLMVGTESMEMAEELIGKLDAQDYSMVDLCGDFNAEIAEKLSAAAGGRIKVRYADYFPLEMEKMEALSDLSEYGIIVNMPGVSDMAFLELKNEQCNTYVAFVKDLADAKEAARILVQRGVYFIELCSWFDREKTEAVIQAVEGKLPVGSCGISA